MRRLFAVLASGLLLLAPRAVAATDKPLVTISGHILQIPAGDTLLVPHLQVSGIAGSTQCLHADSAGVVTGTSSDCGTGAGSVTSVGLALPAIFAVSGSPVTSAGTLTGTLATESANTVFAGPSSGAAATPTFRSLAGADLPAPGASSLGGIESITSLAHNWISYIDTAGAPHQSRPACADLSDSVASCGTDATNASNLSSGTVPCAQLPALTTDVTTSGCAASIANNAVTNAKAAQMAAHTFKGNNTGSTANASDLTATQLTAELNVMVGDSGSGGTKGLVPAAGAGDAVAGKFLKADGTFAVPPGTATGTVTTTGSPASGNLAKFSGSTSVTNTDLTGDVTTSGGVATTIGANKVTMGDIAQIGANTMLGNWTGSTANVSANAMPSCSDTGGNHLNYVSGTGITCGSTSGAGFSVAINAQTGTSYTVVTGDQNKVITLTNAAAIAVTLPQAGSTGFASGYAVTMRNLGFSLVTITTTTSTIDANGTQYYLRNNQAVTLISDGTNWQILPVNGFYSAGNNTNGAALSLQFPDGTTSGGNARGFGAVDLQTARTNAANVASGQRSHTVGYDNKASNSNAVAMGDQNVASGGDSVALGEQTTASGTAALAAGYFNTASGDYSTALGDHNTTSGTAAFAGGHLNTANANYAFDFGYNNTATAVLGIVFGGYATDDGNLGQVSLGGYLGPNNSSNLGSAMGRQNIFYNSTSGSAAVRLTTDGGSAGSGNVGSIGNNSYLAYTVECVIADKANNRANTYTFGESLLTRGANAASTAVSSGNPTATAGPTTSTGLTLQAIPSIAADTTNGGLNISYTPPTSNTDTLYAVCKLTGTETNTR